MLKFDSETHTYCWDGQIVPSVTQILKGAGMIDSRFFKPGAAERGTYIHSLCEKISNGYDVEESGYTAAFKEFLKDTKMQPALTETMYYSDYGFAGTMDLIAFFKGELVIVDIKTGICQEWWKLQLAAYSILIQRENIRRFSLEIKDTGKYKLTEYKDYENDKNMFLGALEDYRFLNQM